MADLQVTLLGAGQEVGRSCCVLQYRGITVVCDAGVHPAHQGIASLPFVDALDWSTVDALLITHFHLDHAAGLTYIMEKTNFKEGKGKVYMSHPTKAVYRFLMQDFVRTSSEPLFTPADLSLSLSSIIPVSAHQLISVIPGLSFTPYHAGHVLGAVMFLIDIAGLKILYTGDYSREEDRHLVRAELPPLRPDVLIVESTYGTHSLQHRAEKEARFLSLVHGIIRRGGHVLMPVFALGRAQELLLVLDEYWKNHPELHSVPVYFASSLARKCMAVYQTYIHTMNANIRGRFARRDNPFVFKHISSLPQSRGWERKLVDGPPCVILASPGMLQSGPSRELLELMAPDPRNGLIITGYSVDGTLARDITNEPEEITPYKGGTAIPRRMTVDEISFSAHVDYAQNSEYIELVNARHVVLVHGEANGMGRLRAAMQSRYKDRNEDLKIHAPKNLETLNLTFRGEHVAKAIGTLASKPIEADSVLSGLLVAKDYSYTLLDPSDLRDFAGLSTGLVAQRQRIPLTVGWPLVRWHLEGLFGSVEEGFAQDGVTPALRVMGIVDILREDDNTLAIEWDSTSTGDMIADSVVALLLGIDSSPASVKITSAAHEHGHPHCEASLLNDPMERIRRLSLFFESHFGNVRYEEVSTNDNDDIDDAEPALIISLDGSTARLNLLTMSVVSDSDSLRNRLENVMEMATSTIGSLSQIFKTNVSALELLEKSGIGSSESKMPDKALKPSEPDTLSTLASV